MIRVSEVTSRQQLQTWTGPWQSLVERAPESDLFQSPQWLLPWLDAFWNDRPLAFLFIEDGERLIGLAPLVRDRGGELSCLDSFTLPVNPHTRRLDVLFERDPRSVLEAVLSHLRGAYPRVRLTLPQCRTDSAVVHALTGIVTDQPWSSSLQQSRSASPIVRLGDSFETYLASRHSHARQELERKVRKLAREWTPEWTVASSPEECTRAMPAVLAIEEKSWKAEDGTALHSRENVRRFYLSVARRMAAAGWLRLYLLSLNGRPAAYILGAQFRDEYLAIKTSYDQELRRASPGQVLFHYALRDSFERRLAVFDFLGDDSRWKTELANGARAHLSICASSQLDAYCRWCIIREKGLKPLVREAAPGLVALKSRLASRPDRRPPSAPRRKEG